MRSEVHTRCLGENSKVIFMDYPKHSRPGPALLLVKEIEILQAQIRLVEICLTQVQLAAEDRIARMEQQYNGELTGLRTALTTVEQILAAHESVITTNPRLLARFRFLKTQLAEQQHVIENRNAELKNSRSGAEYLRVRIGELESAASLADLRAQVSTDPEHHSLINDRESQKSTFIESAREFMASDPRRHIEELKTELRQTEQIALNRRPNEEITTEEFTMDMEDRNKQAAGDATALQESGTAPSAVEQSLRNEIDRLLHEAQEKNQILQDRNDELVRVKAEMDRLQERLNQVESSTSRAQSALAGDVERMHTEFQAQLALLQAELSQKEWALEDKQAAARGLEQKYREEIESLRRQLAQREINQAGDEFVFDETRVNIAQQEQFEPAQNGGPSTEAVNLRKSQRRWHSGVGWKRRWRE